MRSRGRMRYAPRNPRTTISGRAGLRGRHRPAAKCGRWRKRGAWRWKSWSGGLLLQGGVTFGKRHQYPRRRASADFALDLQMAAPALDQVAGLVHADAIAGALGRGEGAEQVVADEGVRHAGAVVGDFDHGVAVFGEARDRDAVMGGVDRVLHEVLDRG